MRRPQPYRQLMLLVRQRLQTQQERPRRTTRERRSAEQSRAVACTLAATAGSDVAIGVAPGAAILAVVDVCFVSGAVNPLAAATSSMPRLESHRSLPSLWKSAS